MSSGSARARLPNGAWLSRPRTDLAVEQWHNTRVNLGKDDLTVAEREELSYQSADICAPLVVAHGGTVGEVARSMGGSVVAHGGTKGEAARSMGGSVVAHGGTVDEVARSMGGLVVAHGGTVGEVARSTGGSLAVPIVDPTQVRPPVFRRHQMFQRHRRSHRDTYKGGSRSRSSI